MADPVSIFECPVCGRRKFERFYAAHDDARRGRTFRRCDGEPVLVRMFREEDVRLLWDGSYFESQNAADTLPAPDDWKALEQRVAAPPAAVDPEDLCTGCGVRPGQTHWDNCAHHPPFSQPVYRGGGR